MEKIEINGKLFQINFFSWNQIYIVSIRDGEEFRVPYSRSHFKTKKGALKRCEELAK